MTHSVESFWAKVERHGKDECWPWIGKAKADAGYGRIDIWGEKGVYAPRVAYLIAHPKSISLRAPKDRRSAQFIRHRCDNPSCCNPRHLLLGTHDENMRDKVKRNRMQDRRGELGPRAKLTSEDVFWIRMQKKYGATIQALTLLYEVSRSTISGCLYGRHYQDVIT